MLQLSIDIKGPNRLICQPKKIMLFYHNIEFLPLLERPALLAHNIRAPTLLTCNDYLFSSIVIFYPYITLKGIDQSPTSSLIAQQGITTNDKNQPLH